MPCGYCKQNGHNRSTCPQLSGMTIEERRIATVNSQNQRSREQAVERQRQRQRQRERINRTTILMSSEFRQREQHRRQQSMQRQQDFEREVSLIRERQQMQIILEEERRRIRVEWCLSTFNRLISHYNNTSDLDELFRDGSSPEEMVNLIGHRYTNEIMLMNYHKIKASEKKLVEMIPEPKEATECPICMEELTSTDLFVTRCGHSYHGGCLMKHLTRNDNCPCCRGVLI